jgi:hypothetical protein
VAIDASFPKLRAEREQVTRETLVALFADQRFDVLTIRRRLGAEWDKRLAAAVFDLNMATATKVGDRVATALGADFNPVFMRNWLLVNAESTAVGTNDSTRTALDEADDDDAKASVFEILTTSRAAQLAATLVTTSAMFGAHNGAEVASARTKTWTGGTTRHGRMNGETVPLSENFSNGLAWPGDPSGGAEEVANCHCSVIYD